ncbi:hypothetical protein AVEN_98775-1 [Araneus ventricosus]|uniref:Uncharacterized protein n=1 Tax=Araneus ventricosus TaxID=182803 RepID=A0A4Y2LB77_ARAVE|nr:hypothetical protein AVEN_98775-1 [Araneus ventricosus]
MTGLILYLVDTIKKLNVRTNVAKGELDSVKKFYEETDIAELESKIVKLESRNVELTKEVSEYTKTTERFKTMITNFKKENGIMIKEEIEILFEENNKKLIDQLRSNINKIKVRSYDQMPESSSDFISEINDMIQ